MRKIILVAAMVLASASAQAGGPRSLSLAANSDQPTAPVATTTATTTATAEVTPAAPVAETPKYVDRPAAVSTTTPAPATATTATPAPAPAADKTAAKADKPKHKRYWTEGRIISELHRHGVYW
ncbi:hypothetical protein [Bradyrhizobium sp.]|uniref:hypothetical protein n=1 Tax=Bradyrhizobium sp. TaxID=376 RepID=UPI0039E56525